MITLSTSKRGQTNVYTRTDTDNKGRVIYTKECDIQLLSAKEGNRVIYTLCDSEYNSSLEAHKYLNMHLMESGVSQNTRRHAANAIRKFLSFLDLMDYSMHNLGTDEVQQLVIFLQGTGELRMSNSTVNSYLAVIREFLAYNEIECKPLTRKHSISKVTGVMSDFNIEVNSFQYDINLPSDSHRRDRVPRYVTFEQYTKLTELANKAGDTAGVMLIHLMFRYGMRLGECLGLTEEDVVYTRISGVEVPTLILRNRVSDESYQCAKCKISPTSKEEYSSAPYIEQWREDDYSKYYLTEATNFFPTFLKFVEGNRRFAETQPKNYATAKADIVYPKDFRQKGLKENHYIFLNRLGKRLSGQVWGKTLKEYFKAAGISVDENKRSVNLSHRFRHGFAMVHARFMDPPVPPKDLQRMMHHRSPESTAVYYNPTLEDQVKMKTEIQNSFYDNNPVLNDIFNKLLED